MVEPLGEGGGGGQEDRKGGEGKSREKNRGKQERMERVGGVSCPPMETALYSPCYIHS